MGGFIRSWAVFQSRRTVRIVEVGVLKSLLEIVYKCVVC